MINYGDVAMRQLHIAGRASWKLIAGAREPLIHSTFISNCIAMD
jgi:hypothetical protein